MSRAAVSPTIGTKGVPRLEREQQIVGEAIAEFAAHGYSGASMVDIAQRAGISKPLIYQYFGSKDGLYLACLHAVAGDLANRLEQAELEVDDSLASRIASCNNPASRHSACSSGATSSASHHSNSSVVTRAICALDRLAGLSRLDA